MENWRSDAELSALWLDLMGAFTTATADRITADRDAIGSTAAPGVDDATLAATLTWLGERLYYLAAIGVEPFTDEEALVEVLTLMWMSTLYPGK
ncbi:hypothetical protein ACFQ9X_19255 [Catenulispora yoronensis]